MIPNYWLTPIISGILMPFSILLEIPGLAEHEQWYICTDSHKLIETKLNSIILIVGLCISISSLLAANLFLILRFLEKRVKTMTIMSIAFLTLHCACFTCYTPVKCHIAVWTLIDTITRRLDQHHSGDYMLRQAPFRQRVHLWACILDDRMLHYNISIHQHHARLRLAQNTRL
jgi:hypothetical protein